MNKLTKASFMQPKTIQWRKWLTPSNHTRSPAYNDKFLDPIQNPGRKLKFEHTWSMMAHMHDLRVWTLAYAPSNKNNLKRMQELHRLNAEMWYQVSNALWKRLIFMFFFYFFVTKTKKSRYMNQGMTDS